MHISWEYYNIMLYYNRKIGYGSIWRVGGGSKAQKVSEYGNFADFGPHLGAVEPLKMVSQ